MNEMRTRFLTRMINSEVEDFLERRDVIFVPIGAVETHGGLPLDCEAVLSEAFALKMAEAADGLVLPNLCYFYAGGTAVGRGTVQMSISEGTAYLKEIALSLLNQGFKRQIYLSFHGPASLTASAMVRDFFDRTKVPIVYIDLIRVAASKKVLFYDESVFFDLIAGGYSLLGKIEEVPLNVPESNSVCYSGPSGESAELAGILRNVQSPGGAVGFYYNNPSDHMGTPLIRSAEERAACVQRGERLIYDMVDAMDIPGMAAAMKQLEDFNRERILPRYGTWLPHDYTVN